MYDGSIKSLPKELRPRERIQKEGPSSLSSAELLAVLLQSGTAGMNVVELAQEILAKAGSIRNLHALSMTSLCEIKGIGKGKACIILSLIELARRMEFPDEQQPISINSPQSVVQYLLSELREYHQEVFYTLFLNTKYDIICCEEVFKGTLNRSIAHPRDVFRKAVHHNAHSIIVAHTHPSGDLTPSVEDGKMTAKFVEGGKLLSIPVLDHIIFSYQSPMEYYSFREEERI